jgi:hypothetical protein
MKLQDRLARPAMGRKAWLAGLSLAVAMAIGVELAPMAAWAQAVYMPVSMVELVEQSNLIVVGTVSAVGGGIRQRGGKIETPVEVQVERPLKGPVLTTIVVMEPGGKTAEGEEILFNQVIPAKGEKFVLFLKTHGTEWSAVAGLHGHYRIADGKVKMYPAMARILRASYDDEPVEKLVHDVQIVVKELQ